MFLADIFNTKNMNFEVKQRFTWSAAQLAAEGRSTSPSHIADSCFSTLPRLALIGCLCDNVNQPQKAMSKRKTGTTDFAPSDIPIILKKTNMAAVTWWGG